MMTTLIRQRGTEDYEVTFAAMRDFTNARDALTPDELWIVEHPPVFTLGLGADPAHVLNPQQIPVIPTDRGGEVTYHGPGQVVIYLLFDLRREGRKLSGQTLFADFFLKDDTGIPIICRIDRWKFEPLGRIAMERLVAEQDVLLVRGKKIPNFGMIKVERVKVLNRQEPLQ